MKIAYIYDVIYPYVKGGAERHFWELAVRLSRRGHEVHLFGMKSWEGPAELIKDGVHIHGVGRARALYLKTGKRSTRQVLLFAVCLLAALWKMDFDIIDCNAFPYLTFLPMKIFARLKRIPMVVTWQEVWGGYWYKYSGYAQGLIARLIEKSVVFYSRYNTVYSQKTRDRLMSLGMPKKDITIIPPGVDVQLIENTPSALEKSDLIFVGRLIREKRVDVLIEAVSLIKEGRRGIKCLVVGDGPQRPALAALATKLGLEENVVFKGSIEFREIVPLMKASGIFVFPSEREGFGIVVIEAMASGLPVVTVNHPMNAAVELVREGRNGFICVPSPEEIAGRIRLILGDEALRQRLSKEALESVREYDWEKITDVAYSYYNEVIRQCG